MQPTSKATSGRLVDSANLMVTRTRERTADRIVGRLDGRTVGPTTSSERYVAIFEVRLGITAAQERWHRMVFTVQGTDRG